MRGDDILVDAFEECGGLDVAGEGAREVFANEREEGAHLHDSAAENQAFGREHEDEALKAWVADIARALPGD